MASKKINQSIKKFREEILSGEIPYGYLLPSEKQLAEKMQLSRPTVSKIYNVLCEEGLVQKKAGHGTSVIYKKNVNKHTFGLLFPGAGESEIFGEISDCFLNLEKENNVKFLWDGTIANDAMIRQNTILEICESYLKNKVDGIFFAPLEMVENASFLNNKVCEMIDRNNIPIILLDRDVVLFPLRSKYPVIGLDNYRAGYMMTQHLIMNGCEKIYFLCRKGSANSVYKRIMGCNSSCFDAGIDFEKEHLIVGDPADIEVLKKIKISPGKTGVLCVNDSTASILLANINKLDVEVTKDILIAGFDNMKYSEVLQVPLTTYQQPIKDIVSESFKVMLNIAGNRERISMDIVIGGEMIVRKSTTFL